MGIAPPVGFRTGRAMALPLGAMFAIGGLIAGVWDVIPELGSPDRVPIAILALVAVVVGLTLRSGACDRMSAPMFELTVAGATVIVSAALYFGGPNSGFALGYLFATPYAFWFFSRGRAMAQVAFVAVCYIITILLIRSTNAHTAEPLVHYIGRVILLTGAVLAVGELVKALTHGLLQRDERFTKMFLRSPMGIVRTSLDGKVLEVNPAFCEIVGRSESDLIGETHAALTGSRAGEDLASLMSGRTADEDYPSLIVEREYARPDGSTRSVELALTTVRAHDDELPELWCQVLDITDRRRHEQQLQYLADHDPLTGLLNRRRFERELDYELRRVRPDARKGAVMTVDLDGFKAINDSAGHDVGDRVLRQVAQTLEGSLRTQDVVARVGGDEFIALLPDAGQQDAATVAERVLNAMHSLEIEVGEAPYRLTASIGVALFDAQPSSVGEMMINADLAMYDSKLAGRDRLTIFAPHQAKLARGAARVSWGQRIRDALNAGRFELHCQPIIDLTTGEMSHGELLLRMREGAELIAPSAFLGAAERLGLIHAIDRWVVTTAVDLVAAELPYPGMHLSLNLSAESVVGDPGLLSLIETRIRQTGADPSRLIFEITETASIASMPEAVAFGNGVHHLGAGLALDDFGAGFASFYQVKHLPLDYLKIDGEFIRELADSSIDQQLVSAIVAVARALGARTVAEMVEHERTVPVLSALGVDLAQGFHFGPPKPITRVSGL